MRAIARRVGLLLDSKKIKCMRINPRQMKNIKIRGAEIKNV